MFPVALVWTNHWPALASNWIGCPASAGFLSDTLLIILNLSVTLATVLTKTGTAKSAFVFDDAILIWLADRAESWVLVIAKYTVCGSIFSGKSPLSAIILIDSPFASSCPAAIVNTDLVVALASEWVAS